MRELMCAIFGAVLAFSICTIFRSDHPSNEKKVAPQPSFESWKEKVNKKQEKKSCIVAPRAPLYRSSEPKAPTSQMLPPQASDRRERDVGAAL